MLRVSGHLGKFLPVRLGLWTLRGEFCEVLDRLCGRRLVALLERRGGDVLPTVEVVRVNGDRLAVLGDGAFVVAAVEEGVSEVCANVGRVGLDGERALVERRGGGEVLSVVLRVAREDERVKVVTLYRERAARVERSLVVVLVLVENLRGLDLRLEVFRAAVGLVHRGLRVG